MKSPYPASMICPHVYDVAITQWVCFRDLVGAEKICRWHKSTSLAHDSNDSSGVENLGKGAWPTQAAWTMCMLPPGKLERLNIQQFSAMETTILVNQQQNRAGIFIPGPVAPLSTLTASRLVLKASCARIWSKAMRRLSDSWAKTID